MDYAVLEPSVISISQDEWDCEVQRDDYLEHFNLILKNIENNQDLHIAWSSETDDLIWAAPQRPPWRRDRTWANTIIPILFKSMQNNLEYIDIEEDSLECTIEPPLKCYREELTKNFKNILAHLHDNCEQIIIPLGLKNIPVIAPFPKFSVDENELAPPPSLISCCNDFLKIVKVEETFWPKSGEDAESLREGINLLLKRNHNIDPCIVHFDFKKSFVKKLSVTQNSKLRILELMAKRLSKTTAEAGRDPVLQDEKVEGKSNKNQERRFRVTPRPSSKRIHYSFDNSKIIFKMFYDSGEHDDGL